jgi:biotin carboxyl carrier protein
VLYRYHPEAPVESLADREILRIRKDLELSCAERNLLSKTIDNMMRMDIHSSQEFDESVLDVDLEISRTLSKRNLLQKRLTWMVQNHEKAGDMIFTKRALELVRKTDKEMVGYRENSDPAVFDLQEQIKTLEQTLEDLKRHRESLILSQIREMNRKRESLDHEILAAETHLKELSRWSRSEESAQGPERVLSPVSGEVYKTYKQRGDPFKRNDIILTVIEPDATVSIEGYFPEKELKYVTAGKEVTVIFPDGRKCRGVIDTIFAAASSQPELLKENYIPIESGLVVAIRPLLAREAHLWRRYDRMDARIRLNKWNMNI